MEPDLVKEIPNSRLYKHPDCPYPHSVPIDPKRQIRVLDLLPGSGADRICCELLKHDLDLDTNVKANVGSDYDALSYVWGKYIWKPKKEFVWKDLSSYKKVRLNGAVDFPVTCNLWRALHNLRKLSGRYRLWVDQLCIDQQNKDEKLQQVQHIGRIFGQAHEVLVWLGDPDTGVDLSFDRRPGETTLQALRRFIPMCKAISRAATVSDDYINPWWTRSWVVEEYSLARDEPKAIIGRNGFPLGDLLEKLLPTLILDIVPLVNLWSDGKAADCIAHIVVMQALREPKFERSIFTLAYLQRQTKTLFPHDKVYCLLTSLPKEIQEQISKDYDSDESRVFAEATVADIRASGNLAILSLVSRGPSSPPGFPSWVVDFTFGEKGSALKPPLPKFEGSLPERFVKYHKKHTNMFSALIAWFAPVVFKHDDSWKGWCRKQPTTKASIPVYCDYSHLELTGLRFDTVSVLFDLEAGSQATSFIHTALQTLVGSQPGVIKSQLNRQALKLLSPAEKRAAELLKSSPGAYQRIGTSPSASCEMEQVPRQPISHGAVPALYKEWDRLARPHNAATLHESITGAVWDFDGAPSSSAEMFELIRRSRAMHFGSLHVGQFFNEAAFFITKAGFIGVGPPDIGKDDEVVLPYGSRYPMIVRRNEDNDWKFMGLVYIRGIMDDELTDCFPAMRFEEKRYRLV